MKSFKKSLHYAALLPVLLFASMPASAQVNFDAIQGQLNSLPGQIATNYVNPIINVILLILFLAVVVGLVIAYINKRKDNNNNSNDKIIDQLWTALIVILGIYGAKFLFIGA